MMKKTFCSLWGRSWTPDFAWNTREKVEEKSKGKAGQEAMTNCVADL